MGPLAVAAILAATGLAKSELIDRPKEARQRKLKAEEQRYSPWSGLGVNTQVQEADPLGSAMQYGMTGASLGQSMEAQDMKAQLAEKNNSLIDSEIARNQALTASAAPQGQPTFYGSRNPWDLGPSYNRTSPYGYSY